MITGKDRGRMRGHQTDNERLLLLKYLLEGSSPDCVSAVKEILAQPAGDPQAPLGGSLLSVLSLHHYEHQPVDPLTFLRHPVFLGLGPGQIRAKIEEDFVEVFRGNYSTIILSGAIGWGKSSLGALIAVRMLYELGCLRNPQASLGLRDGTRIDLLAMSATISYALKTLFEPVVLLVKESPFFRQVLGFQAWKKELRLVKKNISYLPVASNQNSGLSLNVYGAFMDEAEFLPPGKNQKGQPTDRAEDLYNTLRLRMNSRYMGPGGVLPGKMVLMSSTKNSSSFMERLIRKLQYDPNVFMRNYMVWETRDQWRHRSGN